MRVKDIMRTGFVSFQRDDRLKHVLQTFAKHHVSSAPVFDDDEFIGIICTNDIVKFFRPKKFFSVWKSGSPVSPDDLKNVIAADMAVKPKTVLSPDQKLSAVLDKITKDSDCIPVLDKRKKLVGIVRNADVVNMFLHKFAKGEYLKPRKGVVGVGTEIDKVLEFVKGYEWVTVKDISRALGMSVKTVEKMGEVLREHHLVNMRYSFWRGAELGSIKSEKAHKGKRKPKKKKRG